VRAASLFALLSVAASCGGERTSRVASPGSLAGASSDASDRSSSDEPAITTTTTAAAPTYPWAEVTRSPTPLGRASSPDPREVALSELCGTADAALARVASEIATTRARGLGAPDADAVVARLRAAGEPHVRPRLVTASGRAPLEDSTVRALFAASPTRGAARCGIALAPTPHGGEVLVAVMVEALADLGPLPTRARTGEWLSFDARLHVRASSAKLVVLGPHGLPRTVPTNLDASGATRARFALDQPGAFTVQLVADLPEGPRPVLEARVFADVPPTPPGDEVPAPGEDAAAPRGAEPADHLERMVAALRATERLPQLLRDAKLDALARAHAERMRDTRTVAHDAGEGDLQIRFAAEGSMAAREIGENVAHAPTVARAHRVLHASPSHRMNLLRADYTHAGFGVATAEDGSVYVCEAFAATR